MTESHLGTSDTGVKCRSCGLMAGTDELHSCPFAEEIHDNSDESCNCCSACEHECAMDI